MGANHPLYSFSRLRHSLYQLVLSVMTSKAQATQLSLSAAMLPPCNSRSHSVSCSSTYSRPLLLSSGCGWLAPTPTKTQRTYQKGCQTLANMPLHSLEPHPLCELWIVPLPQPARTSLVALTCPHEQHSHNDNNLACLQLPVFVQPFHGDVTCREETPQAGLATDILPLQHHWRI